MDRKEFQKLAVRTESIVEDAKLNAVDEFIFYKTLVAFNEIVEVLDIYKKFIFYGKDIDRKQILTRIMNAIEAMNKAHEETMGANHVENGIQPPRNKILTNDSRIFHALLGTITEHGEIGLALQNALDTGTFDLVNICEELGDSDWYKALFYEATNIDWETVQKMIIKKLEVRYVDKVFSSEDSQNRNLDAERELLESIILEAVEAFHNGKSSTI